MNQKGFTPVLVLLIIALIGAGLFGAYYLGIQKSGKGDSPSVSPTPSGAVYCPQDVRACPDGSFVGRIPPKCEFIACPPSEETANWKTYTSNKLGLSFRYPSDWKIESETDYDFAGVKIVSSDYKADCGLTCIVEAGMDFEAFVYQGEIELNDIRSNKSLLEEKYWFYKKEQKDEFGPIIDFKIDGLDAIYQHQQRDPLSASDWYFKYQALVVNKRAYLFRFNNTKDDEDKAAKIFMSILSTVKFLN